MPAVLRQLYKYSYLLLFSKHNGRKVQFFCFCGKIGSLERLGHASLRNICFYSSFYR